jgi:molecular chaperone DnaK (HSP70)
VLNLPEISVTLVQKYIELLNDAVKYYQQTIKPEEKAESRNPKYSLLPSLKKKIKKNEKLSRELFDFLNKIMEDYKQFLTDLTDKTWSNKENIKKILTKITNFKNEIK